MSDSNPAMPLLAMRAAVLDTETTGLDARTARLVQVAAVGVTGVTIDDRNRFETLVDPGVPVPAASTAIHGIADADLAGAPTPGGAIAGLQAFLGERVVIGHTIAYDLEILKREAARSGDTWRQPMALDVRLLARAAIGTLADYSLDGLCAWLGIAIEGRHRAMGDALATAKVYAALVPRLRRAGIRTLAEAQAVSRSLAEREAVTAGQPAVPRAPEPAERSHRLARIDGYPYSHRVQQVMSAPPATLPLAGCLDDAVKLLIERKVSSAFVIAPDGERGIVTERDVLRVLAERGAAALATPLGEIWSRPLQTVRQEAFVYRAIGRMERKAIRHLGVVDGHDALVGAVTARNLLKHRASAAMVLGDEIAAGADAAELGAAWGRLPLVAGSLLAEGLDAPGVAAVISAELCALTGRAAELGEARMAEAGRGPPPLPYAVLVLGSAGRGESLLSADQDNAIVYDGGASGGAEDAWFAAMAEHMTAILDQVGVPYCKGGVMATNAPWRRSLQEWMDTVDDWIDRKNPEDLLNVDIFFDAVAVHGDRRQAERLQSHAYAQGARRPTFWRALGEALHSWRSPRKLLGGFRTDREGRVDLKMAGLFPLVAAGRIVAIKTGTVARGTAERLRAAPAHDLASAEQVELLIDAQRTILGAVLRQQIVDCGAGVRPSPRVDPGILSRREREALAEAVGRVPQAIDLVREGML